MRVTLVLVSCVAVGSWAQTADAGSAGARSAGEAETVQQRLDAAWRTRDSAEGQKQSEQVITEGLESFGTDYGVLWRAARYRWWLADGASDEKQKKRFGKEAWDLGLRAVAQQKDGIEGRYYVALSIGAYSQAVGILAALGEGLEGKFVEGLDFVIAHDAELDRCGGYRAKGRYYWALPWPKRDLKKSKQLLEKAIEKHPEHLRNHLYLAETLLKDGDPKGAKAENDLALNGSDSFDPPEARRVKAWAKTLGAEIEKALK